MLLCVTLCTLINCLKTVKILAGMALNRDVYFWVLSQSWSPRNEFYRFYKNNWSSSLLHFGWNCVCVVVQKLSLILFLDQLFENKVIYKNKSVKKKRKQNWLRLKCCCWQYVNQYEWKEAFYFDILLPFLVIMVDLKFL